MSEVIPTCLPENRSACHARVIAPGQLVSGSLRLLARPVAALTLLAGGGVTRSTSFSSEDTNSESSSTALHAGIRVHPFRSDGRGPGLELIATRFSREIGSVRWLIAPAMVWRF